MKKATDFISYALARAKPNTVPSGAKLPISKDEVGSVAGGPWEYLYGTTGKKVTKSLLNERYNNFYGKKGWSREDYDIATENWVALKKTVTDCQGLLDSFLGTDVTANYCYTSWCSSRGKISDIDRPYKIGEALFHDNGEGRMTHVGFVCGFLDGQPLVVEARGIRFGVVVTKFSERPWTNRGLVTSKLNYDDSTSDEQIILKVTTPMIQGTHIMNLQKALNSLGYYCGTPDGKCGKLTMSGVKEFAKKHV